MGYALLSRCAAIISTITSNRQTENLSISFKNRAITALRERLARMQYGQADLAICWDIYALFSAEIATHNFAAAQVHGKFLRQILQREDGCVIETDTRFRHAVMYYDIQRASLSLTRPSFDLSRWLTEFLPGTGLQESGLMVALPPIAIDSSVPNDILRNILIDTKEWLTI